MERRAFITGLVSFVAAPAIVRASNLMAVKTMPSDLEHWGSRVDIQDLIRAQAEINERHIAFIATRRWISREEALAIWPAN